MSERLPKMFLRYGVTNFTPERQIQFPLSAFRKSNERAENFKSRTMADMWIVCPGEMCEHWDANASSPGQCFWVCVFFFFFFFFFFLVT